MNKYMILCVDDERDVLDAVLHDLSPLANEFHLEACESVNEARELLAESTADGVKLALILCDHMMPGERGVDFLIELEQQDFTQRARKVLLTGQAGLEETVEAVNNASLDYYIAKPWNAVELRQIVIDQLTTYVIESESNLLPWVQILDADRLMNAISERRLDFSDN
ncbi:response regulator [Parasalinivibrio latis]|uniref:response regulator n=1 Tax=Parasalinivibrio latis TaxID=2952610 RepID=UPI0030DE44C7